MITLTTGDIFQSPAQAIVNPVNCIGIMGAGLALQFKKKFPDNFQAYAHACRQGQVRTGKMHLFDRGAGKQPRYIINFPTKRHWRHPSRLEYLQKGLEDLVRTIRAHGIVSVTIPPLGAGLGGLPWTQVKPRIIQAMEPLEDVQVTILQPRGAP